MPNRMLPFLRILVLAIVVPCFIGSAVANAESPREQLKQMVEQLQKTPGDDVLREKIIKLALELKPAPAVPDAAVEFEGRAQFAFKSAKSPADYIEAAEEYEKAVDAAPWVTGYYSDLCTILEKAGIYVEAKRNCELHLLGVNDPSELAQTKSRIAGLKYAIEKYSKQIQSNKSEPYDAALQNFKSNSHKLGAYYKAPPDFPVGNRYFCYAYYSDNRRVEGWFVDNGSTAKSLTVVWSGFQELAERWRRGLWQIKNPSLQYRDLIRDGSSPNMFYNEFPRTIITDRYVIAGDRSKVDLWMPGVPSGERHYECVPR